ncbi:MAG: 23S rRNA (guanosine(2251)-2'-O)-methyltransferase RlmB [Chitinophagaceae bacterium]|nr:23S rRNA (guanosine(2251)-2'-O)-methyltransferase RlmB [Chitinophagaceae bacterium]
MEAMRNGEQIERIYLANSLYGRAGDEIRHLAEQLQIPVNKVPVEKINGFNIEGHDDCVALKGKINYQDLQQIISFVVDQGRVPLFLILDGITDIRNIGALARTAWCCGVQAIIIPDKGIGALNEDAIATSAGALESISVCRVSSLIKAVDELHLNGIKVFASEMTADQSIYDITFTEPCAIVMGSEDKGIFPALMKVCDNVFKIPMTENFESLNVSVAAGMILYEAMKQRQ